ncbi:MAG: exo-alpha-sialidase, partial [Armatimonadetes bacterium]|nr:exo-alpha-sialidase [Armatimonadota bacterium]
MGAPELQFVEDFSQATVGAVAAPWKPQKPDTAWSVAELDRPRQNQDFWPAVLSPTMHVAFPVMDRDPRTGRLYVVYRQGYTHAPGLAPRDGAVMLVTSDDDGQTWSRPRCIYKDPDRDDRNAAIGVGKDGTLVVCWDQYLHRWHERALAIVSKDGGETWSEPIRLGRTENLVCRGRPIELSDGRWLFPLYSHYGVDDIGDYAVLVDLATGEQEQALLPNEPEDLGSGDE